MPQHKHVTVELLRLPSKAFVSQLNACHGRGTTVRRTDPTGVEVAVIEQSLAGKHMLESNALVPSLPRESDVTTAVWVEAAAARGGHGKKGQALRDRAVAFTAYPDLDGYVDSAAGSVPTWCLLLANSHSELDMAVHVRLTAPGVAWDREFVPYDRPVIVRTDSYVVIKLIETWVLPDPMRIAVEWFHARTTFALGQSSQSTVVTMQIDPFPYVMFDISLEPSAAHKADRDELRVAQRVMQKSLDMALEDYELGLLLIPSSMNVYDKITLARNSFKSIQDLRKHARAKAAGKKGQVTPSNRPRFTLSAQSTSTPPLSSADRPTRKRRLRLANPRLQALSRSAYTSIFGTLPEKPQKKQRRAKTPAKLPVRQAPSHGAQPRLDATLAVAPRVYPAPPAILMTPEPSRATGFPLAFTSGTILSGNQRESGAARLPLGQLAGAGGPSDIVELLSDTSNDVDMDDIGGAAGRGGDSEEDEDGIVIVE